jgi:hypothetical protein
LSSFLTPPIPTTQRISIVQVEQQFRWNDSTSRTAVQVERQYKSNNMTLAHLRFTKLFCYENVEWWEQTCRDKRLMVRQIFTVPLTSVVLIEWHRNLCRLHAVFLCPSKPFAHNFLKNSSSPAVFLGLLSPPDHMTGLSLSTHANASCAQCSSPP